MYASPKMNRIVKTDVLCIHINAEAEQKLIIIQFICDASLSYEKVFISCFTERYIS